VTDLRPLIAISAYWRAASFGPWRDMPTALAPQGYVVGVQEAGGIALLVPPDDAVVADPSPVLDVVDGLLLVGGDDIEPAHYGAEPHPLTDPPNRRRDASELALLRGAVERGMPVLGVCRGFQLLNVVYGGDLAQHLDDAVDGAEHRPELGTFGRHPVDVTGGQLRELVGPTVDIVHSHHHQGLGRVGEGLVVTAHAPDGTIEGIEDPSQAFCLGVLWHPEEDPTGLGAPLFQGLVAKAREYRDVRVTG
jgi:putative glutamine amidotransferase